MENSNDLLSSLSYESSNDHNLAAMGSSSSEQEHSLDYVSLNRLSLSLEKLLEDEDYDYSDAEIVVEDIPVGVHRCLLASRSQFFHKLFKEGGDGNAKKGGKPSYHMSQVLPHGQVGYEAFKFFLTYVYTGKLLPSPPDVSTCVDGNCPHIACRPAIDYAVELMYASVTFQIEELVKLVQRRLFNYAEKALEEDIIPILVAASHCKLSQLRSFCIQMVAKSHLDSIVLEKELPYDLLTEIRTMRKSFQQGTEHTISNVGQECEKRIKKIYKALDSDDIQLLKLLLDESSVTLDQAFALHYAAAYCDPKIFKEVLSLASVDLNRKDYRGYTALHIAARRKAPSILMALLDKGASALERTEDGQAAVEICRRRTRPKDFNQEIKQGEESNKDRICIDLLDGEIQRISMSGSMFNSSEMLADDLNVKLDYLRSRVALAGMWFPTEAKLAMEIADADWTPQYGLASKGSAAFLKEVDLNETPALHAKRVQLEMQALQETVKKGRRFFPHCSALIDKLLDEMPDDFYLDTGTAEEKSSKKRRYIELKDDIQKAIMKDLAVHSALAPTSSSSSSSPKPKERVNNHKFRKR